MSNPLSISPIVRTQFTLDKRHMKQNNSTGHNVRIELKLHRVYRPDELAAVIALDVSFEVRTKSIEFLHFQVPEMVQSASQHRGPITRHVHLHVASNGLIRPNVSVIVKFALQMFDVA